MKQPEFERKFCIELTKIERESPKFLKAFYIEGNEERIPLSPRYSMIMNKRHPLWGVVEESLEKILAVIDKIY
jgi:hypothetical protein